MCLDITSRAWIPCSAWQMVNSTLVFGNFWDFFSNIFELQLFEHMDVKPMTTEDQLYIK